MVLRLPNKLAQLQKELFLEIIQDDLAALGKYGLKKVHTVANASLDQFDSQVYTKIISAAAAQAEVIVFSNNIIGKAIAPRLSVRLKAGLVSGAVALPDTANGFVVKKNVFQR